MNQGEPDQALNAYNIPLDRFPKKKTVKSSKNTSLPLIITKDDKVNNIRKQIE